MYFCNIIYNKNSIYFKQKTTVTEMRTKLLFYTFIGLALSLSACDKNDTPDIPPTTLSTEEVIKNIALDVQNNNLTYQNPFYGNLYGKVKSTTRKINNDDQVVSTFNEEGLISAIESKNDETTFQYIPVDNKTLQITKNSTEEVATISQLADSTFSYTDKNTTITYSRQGHRIEAIENIPNSSDSFEKLKYSYTNNRNGQPLEILIHDIDGNLREKYTFKYDNDGKITWTYRHSSENNLIEYKKFFYNTQGHILREEKFNSNNDKEETISYTTDRIGNWTEKTTTHSFSQDTRKETSIIEYYN